MLDRTQGQPCTGQAVPEPKLMSEAVELKRAEGTVVRLLAEDSWMEAASGTDGTYIVSITLLPHGCMPAHPTLRVSLLRLKHDVTESA